jgi:cyclohexanecarboxylate-CoA ligase
VEATYAHPRAAEYLAPGGAWDRPSLDRMLTEAAAGAPGDQPLVVDAGARMSGSDLNRAVAHLAGGLSALGVTAGDLVAWQAPNRHEVVLLYRACFRLGAVAGPVHHQAGARDASAMVERLAPRVVLATPGSALLEWLGAIEIGSRAWDDLLNAAPVDDLWDDASALAAVLFTSGSSGAPKGVLHSQRTLAYKASLMAGVHGLTPGDVVLMPAPCAHISGLLNGITLPGAVPFTSVLMARWEPETALELIERERVSFMVGPPTFFVALMSAPSFSPDRVASLRLVSSGGAGVTEAFVLDATERLGARVKRTYGSTEAPTIATSNPDDDDAYARRHDGRAIGAAELRVGDPATGHPVAPGVAGELLVQGPELCCGYLDPAQTGEAFTADGWFRTGDLAPVDEGGWLTIVGRLKDVIIRGGENIAAAEVEAVLESHPDVDHAVAVGYPDAVMGERVCAFVVTRGAFDLETCRSWFAQRGIARFKTPERVVILDALPVLPTGKPDRAALRTLARDASRDPRI